MTLIKYNIYSWQRQKKKGFEIEVHSHTEFCFLPLWLVQNNRWTHPNPHRPHTFLAMEWKVQTQARSPSQDLLPDLFLMQFDYFRTAWSQRSPCTYSPVTQSLCMQISEFSHLSCTYSIGIKSSLHCLPGWITQQQKECARGSLHDDEQVTAH